MKTKLTGLLILLMLTSCGTRKKTVDKEKTVNEIESSGITEAKVSEAYKEKQLTVTDFTANTVEIDENYDIEADSTGEVTINYEKTLNGYKKTFTGVKNLKSTSNTSDKKETVNTAITSESEGNINTDIKDGFEIDGKNASDKGRSELDRDSGFPWWILVLALLIIAYLWLRRKVGFLP